MYPDFSYILHAIFGTAPDNAFSIIKTFGLLLAVSFLASAFILSLEMKRKTTEGIFKPIPVTVKEGEQPDIWFIISQALFGFILGFKGIYIVQNFSDFQADAASVLLSTRGNMVGGILVAVVYGGWQFYQKKKKALPKPIEKKELLQPVQMVGDITIVAAISGLIGAKLFAIFESAETISYFFKDPIGQLFSGTGLAVYGGLILAFFSVLYFVRKRGLDTWHMMDAAAPAIITGYAVGRIGCQLSGDGDWGIENTMGKPSWLNWLPENLWVQTYPHNVINAGELMPDCTWEYCHQLSPGVFPTPIYETIMGFMILGILWSLRKRIQIPGILFFIYMILNGIERFFIEKIRVNDKIHLLGMELTQAEIISVLFVVAGIAGIFYRLKGRNP
jgi:phosphatidylglycerol:prolipoprotein diacylglycerol transferase